MRCLRPSGRARFSLSATWSSRCPTPSTVGAATLIHRHLLRTGSITCNNPSGRLQEWCCQLQSPPKVHARKFCAIHQVHLHISDMRAKRLKDCQKNNHAESHQPSSASNETEGILPYAVHILILLWMSVSTRLQAALPCSRPQADAHSQLTDNAAHEDPGALHPAL